MIKLNTPYHVAEENVTVTFTEVKNGAITGTYPNATLTGTLEENVLSATFHNSAVNAVGLIELTFNENGFEGKWKSGLEPGPMRGKWSGEFVSNSVKDSTAPATLTKEQLKWIETKDSWDYEEAPKEWLDSKDFILVAMKKDESILEYVSENLKDDKELILAAVSKNGSAFQYASDKLKADNEIIWAALTQDSDYAGIIIRDIPLGVIKNETILKEMAEHSTVGGKKINFDTRDLVYAIQRTYLDRIYEESNKSKVEQNEKIINIRREWFEFNQTIYKNCTKNGDGLLSLIQTINHSDDYTPLPDDNTSVDDYVRSLLIEAIELNDEALATILGNVGDNTDLIPKATELLWNKCEKSYWNAINTISLYDEDEGIQVLIEELSRDFVIKVIRETREFDEGTDEEKDEFERFVSDNGLE